MSVPFDEWLAAWLDGVDNGLGVHAGVVLRYGAREVSHLDAFDAGDIKTLGDDFRAAGVAPLQCKWVSQNSHKRVAAAKFSQAMSNARLAGRVPIWFRSESVLLQIGYIPVVLSNRLSTFAFH